MMEYVIWQDEVGDFFGTTRENYDRRIMDARAIHKFDNFESFDEVKECIFAYFRGVETVIIIDNENA